MTDDSNKQETPRTFNYLIPKKVALLTHFIEEGDRISGDDLLIALREHEDGPLPEAFVKYLEKPLSGWEENKPGPKPKGSLFRSKEKNALKMYHMIFTSILKGEVEETHRFAKFAAEQLPNIDDSYSLSEKASRLIGILAYDDQRKGPGIMNKISSRK